MAEADTESNAAVVLLCFEGSDDARAAIAEAGELLAPQAAVVLTVWEPVASWAPTILPRSCLDGAPDERAHVHLATLSSLSLVPVEVGLPDNRRIVITAGRQADGIQAAVGG